MGDPHVATFGDAVWICSKDEDSYRDLTPSHLVWQIKSEDPSQQGITTHVAIGRDNCKNAIIYYYTGASGNFTQLGK